MNTNMLLPMMMDGSDDLFLYSSELPMWLRKIDGEEDKASVKPMTVAVMLLMHHEVDHRGLTSLDTFSVTHCVTLDKLRKEGLILFEQGKMYLPVFKSIKERNSIFDLILDNELDDNDTSRMQEVWEGNGLLTQEFVRAVGIIQDTIIGITFDTGGIDELAKMLYETSVRIGPFARPEIFHKMVDCGGAMSAMKAVVSLASDKDGSCLDDFFGVEVSHDKDVPPVATIYQNFWDMVDESKEAQEELVLLSMQIAAMDHSKKYTSRLI